MMAGGKDPAFCYRKARTEIEMPMVTMVALIEPTDVQLSCSQSGGDFLSRKGGGMP